MWIFITSRFFLIFFQDKQVEFYLNKTKKFWFIAGLFHKAIIQSDPMYSFLDGRYNSRQMGFDLAKKLGFDGNDPEKLVDFLRNQSAIEIAKNIPNILDTEMKVSSSVNHNRLVGFTFKTLNLDIQWDV